MSDPVPLLDGPRHDEAITKVSQPTIAPGFPRLWWWLLQALHCFAVIFWLCIFGVSCLWFCFWGQRWTLSPALFSLPLYPFCICDDIFIWYATLLATSSECFRLFFFFFCEALGGFVRLSEVWDPPRLWGASLPVCQLCSWCWAWLGSGEDLELHSQGTANCKMVKFG